MVFSLHYLIISCHWSSELPTVFWKAEWWYLICDPFSCCHHAQCLSLFQCVFKYSWVTQVRIQSYSFTNSIAHENRLEKYLVAWGVSIKFFPTLRSETINFQRGNLNRAQTFLKGARHPQAFCQNKPLSLMTKSRATFFYPMLAYLNFLPLSKPYLYSWVIDGQVVC